MDPDHDKYLDIINELQKAKIGEPARLVDIRERLLAGKTVYKSDRNYLDGQYDNIDKSSSEQAGDPEDGKTDTASDERIKNLEEELAKIRETRQGSQNEHDRSDSQRMKNLEEKITRTEKVNQQNQRILIMKSEGSTLLLSILLGFIGLLGIGHLYIGRTGRGVGLLITGFVVMAIAIAAGMTPAGIFAIPFFIAYLVIFIWQIFDARKLCKEYNNQLLETGAKLW